MKTIGNTSASRFGFRQSAPPRRRRRAALHICCAALVFLVILLPAAGHADAPASGRPSLGDGAAITPEFAQALYERLAPLRASDGCRLVRFDTSRFRITVGLQTGSGADHVFELATASVWGNAGRRVGGWALAVPAELERDCGATLAAIEQVLEETAAPQGLQWEAGRFSLVQINYAVLAASFLILVLGTCLVLYREVRAHPPPPYALLAILLVWAAALALRLFLSPRAFLHEYFHIAETVSGYLRGEIAPVYGNTGPALFRLVGAVLGRPNDVQVIFLTNAVLASLAIPAVALLDLTLMRSWPRAICAAVLLAVLPQHLRWSAAEDLFIQAVTFGMWAVGLFALYLRTRRLGDALLGAVALSLAMQTRPEMLFFPLVLVSLVLLVQPHAWRILFAWRTLAALSVLVVLLVPRFFDLRRAAQAPQSQTPVLPDAGFYLDSLVLFQSQVTPRIYWVLLAIGLAWGLRRKLGLHLWVLLLFFGYAFLSLTLLGTHLYHLRTQLLPTSYVVLVAAGAASVWMELWGGQRRRALAIGAVALMVLGAGVVLTSRAFVTDLRDQQLEWEFLERTAPRLPERGTLLSAVDVGGRNLDAFPEFLLWRQDKRYELVDVRRPAEGKVPWPPAGEDLLYYQGLFCYFAFDAAPDPMIAPCLAVHEQYVLEPLFVEDLDTQPYSQLHYARGGQGPFRIGFFRLKARR